jgi:hypothetical protein
VRVVEITGLRNFALPWAAKSRRGDVLTGGIVEVVSSFGFRGFTLMRGHESATLINLFIQNSALCKLFHGGKEAFFISARGGLTFDRIE